MMDLLQNFTRISEPNFIENLDTNTFEHPNVHVYWKDCAGKYLGCNDSMASKLGHTKSDALIGTTDYDLHGRIIGSLLNKNDSRVIASNNASALVEPLRHFNEINESKYYSFKSPLRTKDHKVVGVVGISFKLDEGFFTNSILKLSDEEKILDSDKNANAIDFSVLTHRQKCCLYYLIRGLTIKEIAKLQSLSSRTVEHYYEEIKLKLNCKTRSELIAKTTGQLMIMPLF